VTRSHTARGGQSCRQRRQSLSAAPSAFDTGGSVACPAGTVGWGGGASLVGGSGGPDQAINTSEPTENAGWEARVNNTGTSTAQFEVDAICAKQPKGYTIVFRDADNPADSTSALDGGAQTVGHSPLVQVDGSIDQGAFGWVIAMNNNASSAQEIKGYVICAAQAHGGTQDPDGPQGPEGPESGLVPDFLRVRHNPQDDTAMRVGSRRKHCGKLILA
jgi:hypothetical protein